jgi:LacI family kdg operon repressor
MVSERAGVSKTTISRYLNGRFEHMSEATRARIEAVVAEMGYRPNAVARSLKLKRTGLIGVIVPDVANPITVQLIKGVIDTCAAHGYQAVTACSGEEVKNEREYIFSMVDRQVEGLIVAPVDGTDCAHLPQLAGQGVKIVLADRGISKPEAAAVLDSVTTDNFAMTERTIGGLYDAGFSRVGLFSSDLLTSTVRRARHDAYIAQCEAHGAEPFVYLFPGDEQRDYGDALRDFLGKTAGEHAAVFAITPMSLLNLVGAAQEMGVAFPQQLGICGYDNLPWTRLLGITVVEQPFYEVGAESARILLSRIDGEDCAPRHVELNSTLIVRKSTKL